MASSKQDNRKPNTNPLSLPHGIALSVLLDGELKGRITLVQRDKLSPNGNTTYTGAIKTSFGWALPSSDVPGTLAGLSFIAQAVDASGAFVGDPVALERSKQEVHLSTDRRTPAHTVTHAAFIALPTAAGGEVEYAITARPEHIAGKGYQLVCASQPKMQPGKSGPTFRGVIEGFEQLASA